MDFVLSRGGFSFWLVELWWTWRLCGAATLLWRGGLERNSPGQERFQGFQQFIHLNDLQYSLEKLPYPLKINDTWLEDDISF